MKTPERRQYCRPGVSVIIFQKFYIVDFEQVNVSWDSLVWIKKSLYI